MNSKTLLVIGAILALVMAIGCSNNSRTTAPAGVDNTLTLPNDDAASRFNSEQTQGVPDPSSLPIITKVGIYNRTERGCQTLRIVNGADLADDEYIELTFSPETPKDLEIGSLLLVKGNYHQYPGGYCMLPTSIEVQSVYVLSASHSDPGDAATTF
jgi:hypothetical protein